jgi:uncharacterized protein (TIGR03067 family)
VRMLVVSLLPFLFVAADPPGKPDELRGVWTVESAEIIGKNSTDADGFASVVVVVAKDAVFLRAEEVRVWGKLRLDSHTTPHTIDFSFRETTDRDEIKVPGLYELNGRVLRTIWSRPGEARPTDFNAMPQSPQFIFKKVIAEDKVSPSPPATPKLKNPVSTDESPKDALLRALKVFDQADLDAATDLYDYSGALGKDYVRSICKYEIALSHFKQTMRRRFGKMIAKSA